ncbi:peptidoglycan-recognition protein SC2-like [Haliotis rubra]|uniref:peptidoglycan-recognition protein SC2-like n=1 Tax=Haliotis rubra TaxID=36100 RepID=UPI001EE5B8B7|nr:peptidoglycan-recognition protein SC2-like [Haliotis rubra]
MFFFIGYYCLISRSQWGASSPVGQAELARAVEYVFIRDTIGEACFTQISCSALVKSIQDQHMNTFGWYDIGYNFLIGEDGYVYEGRGWNTIGGHTMGYNSKSVGIGMIGSFRTRVPSSEALNTLAALIADGVMMGKIRSNYTLRAENEINNADCHAKALCDLIRASPHY